MQYSRRAELTFTALAVLAAAVWMGGLTTVGAVVAPIVAPSYPDAMTAVFRRFDRVAMSCAAVLVVCEAMRAALGARAERLDFARIGASVVAAGLAVWQGFWLSPRIEELHREGAGRGFDEFDRVHKMSELEAKAQLFLLALVVLLHVYGIARRPASTAKKRASEPSPDA